MGMLREMGCEFTDDTKRADIVLMNTCAIRENAEKTVYGMLGQLTHTKAANPDQIICLCGCMAQQPRVAKKGETSYRHVDLVLDPQAEWRFPELLYRALHRARPRLFHRRRAGPHRRGHPRLPRRRRERVGEHHVRLQQLLLVLHRAYVRGRERSREPEQIVREVRELVAAGYKEITLLGQNVNSYGKDLGTGYDFADLLAEIDRIDGDYWVRFMSSQPKDATPKLFDTMAASRHVTHQLHLPVQSGNDRVLRAMNRPYTRARATSS